MKNGPYELILAPKKYPGKKYRGLYAYEHIVTYWQKTGILSPQGYEIHHKNGNHRDNRFQNLQLMLAKEHRLLHGKLQKVPLKNIQCDNCKKPKQIKPRNYRSKIKRGQRYFFCSQRCQALKQHSLGGSLK